MSDSERKLLQKMLRQAEIALELFTNKGQAEQERTVVHGFLNVLDIAHRAKSIVKQPDSLIDVTFEDAAFQVTEVLDPGRRRGDELKARVERLRKAKSLADLIEQGTISSTPIKPPELIDLVASASARKAKKAAFQCSNVDLLVYVSMLQRHPVLGSYDSASLLAAHSWRSVSVVMEGFAVVLFAGADAPLFLRQRVGAAAELRDVRTSVFEWPEATPNGKG